MKMKKFLRSFIALSLVAVICLGLIACGGAKGPKGTYRDNKNLFDYTFSGNKVSYVSLFDKSSNSGTFTVDGTTVIVSFPNGNHDSFEYDPKTDTLDWMGQGLLIFSKIK